jgi:type II secretory pathway predicted ATPase ExeA/cell division septation protein DedD
VLEASRPSADTLTYEPFFGLDEKPFSLNSDHRFVFSSASYGATRDGLLAGIRRREGMHVLTGEIGTGKTTLCHDVLRELGRKTYSSIVPDPFASRDDLLKTLLIDFGVLSIQEITSGPLRQASRTELGYLLAEFLNSLTPDAFVIALLDEAQNLTLPLIEETRILSDTFGSDGRLQIVFVGQPELHSKLKLPEMRQVDQRVCGYHRLTPMDRDAVAGYIQHRLHVAGAHRERVLFSADMINRLHLRSGGVPRLINRVCDRALQLAYEHKTERVDRVILEAALTDIGSATLSPTWDAIMAEVPAQPSVETPTPAVTTAAPPAVAQPAVAQPAVAQQGLNVDVAPTVDEAEDFQKEVDQWASKDLMPPARRRSGAFAEVTPEQLRAWRRSPRTPSREVPVSRTKLDWSADGPSETGMRRVWHLWTTWVAMASAAFAIAVVVSMSTSSQEPVKTPSEVESVAAVAPPPVPVAVIDAPVTAAPKTEVPAVEVLAVATPPATTPPEGTTDGEYLITVGLFGSQQRANQLVDILTQAGLPAMQRPFQLRSREVQQIVLGPFFSRADAVADLRRLHGLGGYDDAAVIDAARER